MILNTYLYNFIFLAHVLCYFIRVLLLFNRLIKLPDLQHRQIMNIKYENLTIKI